MGVQTVWRSLWSIALGALLVVGLAWLWAGRVPQSGGENAGAMGALPPAPAIGHPAPEFAVTAAVGETFRLSALRGTPVVLNFWATWCPPCRAELPELQAAHERYAREVAVVGVNQAEPTAAVTAFLGQNHLTFPVPLDERGDVSRRYAVRGLPTTFFIDRSGIIRHIQIGPLTEATLAQALRSIYP